MELRNRYLDRNRQVKGEHFKQKQIYPNGFTLIVQSQQLENIKSESVHSSQFQVTYTFGRLG